MHVIIVVFIEYNFLPQFPRLWPNYSIIYRQDETRWLQLIGGAMASS